MDSLNGVQTYKFPKTNSYSFQNYINKYKQFKLNKFTNNGNLDVLKPKEVRLMSVEGYSSVSWELKTYKIQRRIQTKVLIK